MNKWLINQNGFTRTSLSATVTRVSNFVEKNVSSFCLQGSPSRPVLSVTLPNRLNIMEALPGVLGNSETEHLFQGNRETGQILRGTKTILGKREHKINFRLLGNMGISQFISGEQGNRCPPGRASLCQSQCTQHVQSIQ